MNFVQFGNTQSKHTSKHTLHSHGQVMLHAPGFAHLGDRHAGPVLTRCHSVVGRPGGAMPDMAKWIPDSASTLSPLQTSSWCTLPTKKQHALLADLEDGEVGVRGRRGDELLCNGTVVPHAPPPSFQVSPPSAPNPFPTLLMG